MSPHANARDWQTRIRMWAAFTMMGFVFVNMGFYTSGLISPDAMEAYGNFTDFVSVLYPLFFAAITFHIALGLWKLYKRNTLVMPFWESVQIIFGLLQPFLFLPHIIVTNGLVYLFPLKLNYIDRILLTFPEYAWRYVLVALFFAIHAHIGAHVIFRLRPWYPRVRWLIFALFLVLPLVAAAGYLTSGVRVYQAWKAGSIAPGDAPTALTPEQTAFIQSVDPQIAVTFVGIYIVLFGARAIRLRSKGRDRTLMVKYPDGRSVSVFPGTTILEASRLGRIPHASICGGRGRCTTCRVKVETGMDNLNNPGEREASALKRIGAPSDVRLACQAEVLRETVKITPLLPPNVRSLAARKETPESVGRDVELAVMFADLRGFTRLSEGRFPYDVVYILNRYFQDMGATIESFEGHIDKFVGDGILAYIGRNSDPRTACRNAILSARSMAIKMNSVNEQLKTVLDEPLSIGVGIHYGSVILGEMGYGSHRTLTIIGDTVNTASRLQNLNKAAGSQLIVSSPAAAQSGLDLSYLRLATASVRGKTEQLRVYVVPDLSKDLDVSFTPVERNRA